MEDIPTARLPVHNLHLVSPAHNLCQLCELVDRYRYPRAYIENSRVYAFASICTALDLLGVVLLDSVRSNRELV
eukprot:XP_001710311.1 Hypothetical protein GL50803_38033 [Giardia lamblia ATCC 50803]